ncbi:IclR family transcriptional regulator [Nocardia sp. BMG111209]|uniref:IclR family transcriptional regulator n=1 Tax=Nocardia sp. BMG111209 TaxID=1160137 RepID=UPI000374C19B|nr:IclR family transcriptional regulator [Nocardia sp. BMG111209]
MTAETSVLTRALSLVAAFDAEHMVLKLAELADRAGLPQTTAYRYAGDLVAWGALDRAPGGGYQIGLRMLEVAAHCPRGRPLRDVALPYMEDLYEATHQNVQLAVRDGVEVMYVEFLAARNAVAVRTRVGARWPLHATGVGLAILAHSPTALLDEVLTHPLAVFTPKTIDNPERLRRVLAEVRRTGVAISDGQVTLDGYSVAAPVFGPGGTVPAAVSIVVPAGDTKRATWAPAVRTAANGISRALGAATTRDRRRP